MTSPPLLCVLCSSVSSPLLLPMSHSASVERDSMVLLEKSRAAFADGAEDARAIRILQRALAVASTPTGSTTGSAPCPFPLTAIPAVTLAATRDHAIVSGTLPLLSDSIAASSPQPRLPDAQHPPRFLFHYNIGITHLRAGRIAIARIYITRALEESQAITNLMATPIRSASTQIPHAHTTGGTSRSTAAATSSVTHEAGAAALPVPSGYVFIRTQQRAVFQASGLALLLAHSPSIDSPSAVDAYSSDAIDGIRLAYRCFKHCAQTYNEEGATVETASAKHSQSILQIRMGEALIRIHRLHQAREAQAMHPIIPPPHPSTAYVAVDSGSPPPADSGHPVVNEFALSHAVVHFQRALLLIQQLIDSPPSTDDTPGASADAASLSSLARLRSTRGHVELELSHALLTLDRPQEALDILQATKREDGHSHTQADHVRRREYTLEALIACGSTNSASALLDSILAESTRSGVELDAEAKRFFNTCMIYLAMLRCDDDAARSMLNDALR